MYMYIIIKMQTIKKMSNDACFVPRTIASYRAFAHDVTRIRVPIDLSPYEGNFDLDMPGQKFHHSLKEHHKISNIAKFVAKCCKMRII